MPSQQQPIVAPLHRLPSFRLTERDKQILETIHAFDGMLSLRQIDQLFFSGAGRTQPRSRMRTLYVHGYVNTPDKKTVHRVPRNETIYWLNTKGAEVTAARNGEALTGFPWRNKPRWSWLEHDLAVNDFRIRILEACNTLPALELRHWIPESSFLADPDTITYRVRDGKQKKRQVRPDSFFTISPVRSQQSETRQPFAFLLEVDMATHSNPRFAREKIAAGLAYLKSRAYQERFGLRYGRWLVVTTGERRLEHLRETTKLAGGGDLFLFTTFGRVATAPVLTAPIWVLAESGRRTSLIPSHVMPITT
jgi:hypothetical protein